MRIRIPGKIQDRLWYLGREESSVYLLEGSDGSLLINGGLSYIVPDLLEQFDKFRIDKKQINKLLILHSHFDHVGIAPFFKRRFPELTIYASRRAMEILRNPRAIDFINQSSLSAATSAERDQVLSDYDLNWTPDLPVIAVSEKDRLDLGDIVVDIIETPGHSSCSISAYAPDFKALFPSDSGGIPFNHKNTVYGINNYTHFQRSLEILKDLDVAFLCADHFGYVTGQEAREYINKSITTAQERKELMIKTFQKTGSIEKAARELGKIFRDENAAQIVTHRIFVESFKLMLNHIVSELDETG